MRGKVAVFILVMLAAATAGWADSREETGNVQKVEVKPPFLIFDLHHADMRFTADVANVPDPQSLIAALKKSDNSGYTITVTYDPDTATMDEASGKPVFVARAVTVQDKTIVADKTTPPRKAADLKTPLEKAQSALARAIATASDGDTAKPLALLTEALAEPSLPPLSQALALKVRGSILADDGWSQYPIGSAEGDKLLMAALDDARRRAALSPADRDAAENVAWYLQRLGGYSDGLALFKDMLVKWPDDPFWSRIGMVRSYRAENRYGDALAELGKLPDKRGMVYAINLAYILTKQGRWEEVIGELNAGLVYQPDWPGAYLLRGCSNAALGRLKEALADHRKAMELRQAYPDRRHSLAKRFNDARYRAVERALERALSSDPNAKLTDLCEGYWGDAPRARSPLLPPLP